MSYILEVNHLTKRFGELVAVEDVSFSVKRGEIHALIGPNGAGKTTCFNMIAGTYPPTDGEVVFNGKKVTGKKPYELNQSGISRTFQIVKPLKNLTVFENVMVACLSKSKNIAAAKEKAEKVLIDTDLQSINDKIVSSLSIGNLKRLEVARALATKPTLLLMDEPMGGLSPNEAEQAIELIRKVNEEGVTIILVEHIMKAVMAVSDSIAVLQNGKLIANDVPEILVNDEAVIKAYLGE